MLIRDGTVDTAKGVIEGRLAHEPAGENGFGYDPIFYLPERGCTTGELEPEEKNKISHRGLAIAKMVEILKKRGLYEETGIDLQRFSRKYL